MKVLNFDGTIYEVRAGSASQPGISFAGDPNTGIYSPGADQLAISTGGSGRLFVDSSGNIGINYSTPSNFAGGDLGATAPVVIGDGTATRNLTLFGANNGYGSVAFADSTTGSAKYAGLIQYYHTDNSLQFYTNSTERLRITSTGTVNIVGAGTAGSTQAVSFNGSAPVNSLVVDSSGRCGIGTSVPGSTLHIEAAGNTVEQRIFTSDNVLNATASLTFGTTPGTRSKASIRLINSNAGNSSGDLALLTNDGSSLQNRLYITSAGNVGIGTTSVAALLHIANSSLPTIRLDNTSTNYWQISNDSNLIFDRGGTERMRIDASGRLLVGTSTARANFFNSTVTAGLQLEGTADNQGRSIAVTSSSATASHGGQLFLAHQKSGAIGGNTALADGDRIGLVSFQGSDGTNFVEGARVTAEVDGGVSTGDLPTRLVFSTTADGASSPTERLRIDSAGLSSFTTNTAAGAVAKFDNTANTSTDQGIQILMGANAIAATARFITCAQKSVADRLIVYGTGNVQNTNNSYGALSDIKLKENIVDANSQWSDIKALQVRNYNFKEGQTHTQIGLIAQEVEQVSPGLVSESPDRDEDGNDLGTVTKGVNYSVLYMKAVKALQEAMLRIEDLEARLDAANL